jgi:hypothetical protein
MTERKGDKSTKREKKIVLVFPRINQSIFENNTKIILVSLSKNKVNLPWP